LKKIDAKDAELEAGFQEIWAKDDENKIGEIKKFNERKLEKMKEVIKLMERLVEEGKNYKPAVENTQSQGKKRKAEELEVRQGMDKKNKTVGGELSRLIREAQELNNYEELEAKIKEIDKYREEKVYNEDYQEEIKQLKIKLGNFNKDKYRGKVIKEIENKLKESGIKEEDLDEETRSKLTKIKNGEIEDLGQINEVENKITGQVGEKNAISTLNN